MKVSSITIEGDIHDSEWRIPVLSFEGKDPQAPKVYLQAALHSGELPGTAVLHFLSAMLAEAESGGRLLGQVTLVPQANPIGAAQWHFSALQGRFDISTRTNFNRDFPLIAWRERGNLLDAMDRLSAVDRLKRHLMALALEADLVLDLHCDDESLLYAYIDECFWPQAEDLAAAMQMEAVLLSDGESTAFEEAVSHAWKQNFAGADLKQKLSTTLELRGLRDVDAQTAQRDAEGLLRFLALRGVVAADVAPQVFRGPASPLDWVEMIRAPTSGTVLFHRAVGDRVIAGDLLATILTRPALEEGIPVKAPQDGLIVTRVSQRFVRRNDDLMKIAASEPSLRIRKPGTLED